MDVQNAIVGNIDKAEEYIARIKEAVEAAHHFKIPVIFIVVGFRKGYPEINPNNKMFKAISERFSENSMEQTSSGSQPVIKPQENDLVIAKKRISAFAGSDLEMILNAQGINELILCGISTSGVVLSTLRYAADKDYKITVLADGCADHDDEVNRVLLEKVFPRQAEVMTINEWQKLIKDK